MINLNILWSHVLIMFRRFGENLGKKSLLNLKCIVELIKSIQELLAHIKGKFKAYNSMKTGQTASSEKDINYVCQFYYFFN